MIRTARRPSGRDGFSGIRSVLPYGECSRAMLGEHAGVGRAR